VDIYYKVSTSTRGIIKIVDGVMYKHSEDEKDTILFK